MRWIQEGLEYEADPRQVEKIVEELGLEGAKSLSTLASKVTAERVKADRPLPRHLVIHYRGAAARCNAAI